VHHGKLGHSMSALGQKQTWRHILLMSALPPKADIGTQPRHVRFVPKADISISQLAMRLMLSCRAVTRIAAQSYKPTFFMSFRRLPEKDKIHVVTDLGLHSALGAIWACGACASTVSLGTITLVSLGRIRALSAQLRVICDQRSRFPACRSQGRAAALVNRRGAFCARYWSPS